MRKKIIMKIIPLIALLLLACASSPPESTPQTQLVARVAQASTSTRCPEQGEVASSCLDDQGLVWSACAWNNCGASPECRREHQNLAK